MQMLVLLLFKASSEAKEGEQEEKQRFGSQLGKHPDKGSFQLCSCENHPGKVCKATPKGAHSHCREPVEDATLTMSMSASPSPPPDDPLSVASTLSLIPMTSSVSANSKSSLSALQTPEPLIPLDSLSPQTRTHSPSTSCPPNSEDHPPPLTASSAPLLADFTVTLPQCDSMGLPLGNIPQSSSPHTRWSASPEPVPTISGLGHSSCHISTLCLWGAAAKALCLSTSTQCETQQEHRSSHSPEALLWGDTTDRQVEAGSPSFLSSDVQTLLEIQVTKRIKIKLWKEIEKFGSYPKQGSPDYHLNYVGRMLKSLGTKQDTTALQSSWSAKGKPEQLPGTQRLSYPKVLGDCVQQKYNQLFWGLPSLHSESLVATAWISENPSALHSPSFLFNGVSNVCPIQLQAKASPLLSHSLSHREFQSQPTVPSMLQFQALPLAQVQTQANLQSSLPILASSSPPQIRAYGVSCPTAYNKSYSLIPMEIQHPERPWLQKQQESGRALTSEGKRPQEIFSFLTSHLPKESVGVSIVPENFPVSPELWNQVEQHVQKRLIQHRCELPHKVQESLELRQFQGELPGMCQAQDKHGRLGPSSFTGESSKDAQKMGFQLSQDMGKELGHILGKVPEEVCRGSEVSLVTSPGEDSEGSGSDLMFLRSDSGGDVLRSLDKNRENILKGHLGRKLTQISEGFIPVSVRRSWLAVNPTTDKSGTYMKSRNLGILKGCESQVNTTHSVSFLSMDTQELLEAHITRFWVRHRWGLLLKVLKAIKLFKMKKAHCSPTQQFNSPLSASCVSEAHTIVKFAQFLGKAPQAHPGEKMTTEESGPSLARLLLGPSPVCEEIQRPGGGTPSVDDHGPLKASLPKQEARLPSQSLTLTRQSGTAEWAERGSLQPSSSLPMTRNQPRGKRGLRASRDLCHRVAMLDMNFGSQSLSAKETREAVEAKLSPALHPESRVILGTNEMTKSQNINAYLRSLEASGTNKSPPFPRMSVLQDPGDTCLNREYVSEFQSNMRLQSKKQPQDCATHKPLAPDNLTSQVPQCHPQKVPTGEKVASQVLRGLMETQRGSRERQEPRISTLQDSCKNKSKMIAPTYKREDYKRPNSGEHTQELEKCMSPSAKAKGTVKSVDRKHLHWLPEKNQSPPQNFFRNRMRTMFSWAFPHKNLKGEQKHKPKSATVQCQGPEKSRSIMDGETPQAQALMTAEGQILKQKMAIHHEHHAKNLNQHKQQCQAQVRGCFCYHRLPFYPEQDRLRSHTACGHQANSNDQTCSIRDMNVRHRQSLKGVRFHDEQMGLSHFLSQSPKKTCSPVSPCHYGQRMSGAPGHHQHCPGHCHFRVFGLDIHNMVC
ncbi:spermatogenesis-associated protein 31A6-like [Hipposideros larvatus]